MDLVGHMEVVVGDNFDKGLVEEHMYQLYHIEDIAEDMEVVEVDNLDLGVGAYKYLIDHNLKEVDVEDIVEEDNQVVLVEDIVEVVVEDIVVVVEEDIVEVAEEEDIGEGNYSDQTDYMFENDVNNYFLLLAPNNLIGSHHYLSSFF